MALSTVHVVTLVVCSKLRMAVNAVSWKGKLNFYIPIK